MNAIVPEFEELRVDLERLRALLEDLAVRGLRTCGSDERTRLQSCTEHLERVGAGHLAAILAKLDAQIENDGRASAQTLLEAQTHVRLAERLLTLRVARQRYALAVALLDNQGSNAAIPEPAAGADQDDDEE